MKPYNARSLAATCQATVVEFTKYQGLGNDFILVRLLVWLMRPAAADFVDQTLTLTLRHGTSGGQPTPGGAARVSRGGNQAM